MQIVVLVKQVPDLNTLKVDHGTGKPVFGGQTTTSSFDEYAVEEALRLKEKAGGEVTVVAAGKPTVKDVITRALAMGVDRAVQIALPDVESLDTLAVAQVLADEVKRLSPDVVLAGQNSDDYQTGQVGPQVAELLGWPHVSAVTEIEADGDALRIQRDTEDGKQIVAVAPPVVLLALTGPNTPRLPSIKGMMAAKRKPVEQVEATQPVAASRISWSGPTAPERSATGTIVQGVTPAEAAKQLVGWLKENKLI